MKFVVISKTVQGFIEKSNVRMIGKLLRFFSEHSIDLLAILKTNVDRTIFHYNL